MGWIRRKNVGESSPELLDPVYAKLLSSVAIPVEFTAIAVHVAVLAAKFPALVTRRSVVAVAQVATQFATIVNDLRFVVANVAAHAAVTVKGKRRRYAHSYQQ
jgi:hypothetical protein